MDRWMQERMLESLDRIGNQLDAIAGTLSVLLGSLAEIAQKDMVRDDVPAERDT